MTYLDPAPAPLLPPPPPGGPVRVMICDDSSVIRAAMARILAQDPAIQLVARTGHGQAALAELGPSRAEVLILDIEMPVMDGLTALPLLLRQDPALRIIMASSLTTRGADIALRTLRLGAAETIAKPSAGALAGDQGFAMSLRASILGLARQRRQGIGPSPATPAAPFPPAARRSPAAPASPRMVAIASSTGGPQALFALIQALRTPLPVPLVITQHMPAGFMPILAEHIAALGVMPCHIAQNGEALRAGEIVLAPGDHHLLVAAHPAGFTARLSQEAAENFCRPSADPMLRSIAAATAGAALAVILTGMGQDGLLGTRALVQAGGAALVQDEASSVVWGMPGAVARAGLAQAALPPAALGARLRQIMGLPA